MARERGSLTLRASKEPGAAQNYIWGNATMAELLTLGWSGTKRPTRRRRRDMAVTLAAGLLITAQTAAGILEQARVDNEPAQAEASGKRDGAVALGRETVIAAYSGAPYTYPSKARVVNPSAPAATDITIDPVDWSTPMAAIAGLPPASCATPNTVIGT